MQNRTYSEKNNRKKVEDYLKNLFGEDVQKKGGKISPMFYKDGKRVDMYKAAIALALYPETITYKFMNSVKMDYFTKESNLTIEVKNSGKLFCEALGITKSRANIRKFIKLCKSLNLDPVEINNKAVHNLVTMFGKEYIERFISEKRIADLILVGDDLHAMDNIKLYPVEIPYSDRHTKSLLSEEIKMSRFCICLAV